MKSRLLLLTITLFVGSMITAQEVPFTMKWDNGFKLENTDKTFKLKFGGRIMWDNEFFYQDDSISAHFGELNNGVEFRRLRLYNSGIVYDNVDYKLQLDFAGGGVSFKDVFISIKGISGINNLRMGHFKEPIRLESLTSSKYITFMERALPISMIPERNTGIMAFNDFLNNRLSVQLGLFRRADGSGNDERANNGYAITSRVSGIAYNQKDKNQLVHLGGSFRYERPNSSEYKVSSRPESHLGSKYLSTSTITDVADIKSFNIETAMVLNSFSIQGEYLHSTVSSMNTAEEALTFSSYYIQLSYFLTGEHRKYKNSLSGFGRTKPKSNFGKNGHGAWEMALRYSSMDLNDGNVMGGLMSDITFGLNWYLNPVTRIMFNYINANIKDEGNVNIIQTRCQIDF